MDILLATANRDRAAGIVSRPSSEPLAAAPSATLVVGLGSPHGDDLVGWKVIEMLQSRPGLPARLIAVREGSELVANIEGCQRLVIIDACRSGSEIGGISRLWWPDPRIVEDSRRSMHGVTLSEALRLAQSLGRMPTIVELITIEVSDCSPGRDLSPPVMRAAEEVEELLCAELCEEFHA